MAETGQCRATVFILTYSHFFVRGRWRLELYLTPSRLVYGTAAVLGSLFVGIALLVLLLHGRERYQDSRERQQEKHRFHFNAM